MSPVVTESTRITRCVSSIALEHVARRHRKHPNHPLFYGVISAGPASGVSFLRVKSGMENSYSLLHKGVVFCW
jgi:hypothetical protein